MSELPLNRSVLRAYGGGLLVPVGKATLNCKVLKAVRPLSFFLLDGKCAPLLGIQACQDLGLVNFHRDIRMVQQPLDPLVEYPDRFDSKLGKLPCSYKISLNPEVEPVIRLPHRVSFAMNDSVESTLRDMVAMGILKEVSEPTQWVSTMVVAAKKDKSELQICINPKDLNLAIKRPHYPMRTVEDVAAQVGPATLFSVLDAKSSFWQIPLDERSSYLTTFGTPFGRFRFLRMPFRINSASEVFQRTMEQLWKGSRALSLLTTSWCMERMSHSTTTTSG